MVSLPMALLVMFAAAQDPPAQPPVADPHADVQPVYVPQRVYDTQRQAFTDFEVMLADLARADVVFVGEQHGDRHTHRLEAAILAGLLRRGAAVTLSLEMFERDAQPALDEYLQGERSEADFLAGSRPWPRYASDYRPLVEMARAHQWPVLASNVPRRLAQDVAKGGREVIDALSEADRALVARDLQCPEDTYFTRFVETMGSHPVAGEDKEATEARMLRYYWSQCIKDETMAESIAAAVEGAVEGAGERRGPVVHYNGAFHSDFGLGAAERVRRRLPERRVVVLSILPVADLDVLAPEGEDLNRANYLVFTTK
jgi:uncharacterized iron-regulated protein